MTIDEKRAREAVKRLAALKTRRFSERDPRGPFTDVELTNLYEKAFIPYIRIKFMRRMLSRGHDIEGVCVPNGLRGFGV